MAKKRITYSYGGGKDVFTIILILAVIGFAGWFLFGDTLRDTGTSGPQPVDVGDDFPAFVNDDGECVGREGIDLGLCCAVWDPSEKVEKWVLCETLVSQSSDQAFFTFEQGDTLEGVSSVMFAVRLTNEGNAQAEVKINDVQVVATTGGDAAGITEIRSAFESLIRTYEQVQPSSYTELSMTISNRIRLDIPEGIDAFTMTDGTYEATIFIQVKDEQGFISDGGSRSVILDIAQENIAFSIDVTTI